MFERSGWFITFVEEIEEVEEVAIVELEEAIVEPEESIDKLWARSVGSNTMKKNYRGSSLYWSKNKRETVIEYWRTKNKDWEGKIEREGERGREWNWINLYLISCLIIICSSKFYL